MHPVILVICCYSFVISFIIYMNTIIMYVIDLVVSLPAQRYKNRFVV